MFILQQAKKAISLISKTVETKAGKQKTNKETKIT